MIRRTKGFTLLEMLIALTLVTLIVTLLFGGIRLGNRSWSMVEEKSEQYAEMRLIWRFIHERLGQARSVRYQSDEGESLLLFYGDGDGVEFVSPMPAHLGVSGLYIIRFHRNGDELKMTRWLHHPDLMEDSGSLPEWRPLQESSRDPGEGPAEMREYYSQSVLVEDLSEFEIDYFGVAEGETEPDWQDEWEEPELPNLARIQITTKQGKWPEIIAEVSL
jgi:general secretion pathway protein J